MSSHHVPTSQEAIEARKREIGEGAGNHGHSRAAWAGVGTTLFGALVGSFAVIFAVVWLFWVGLALMAAGGLLGRFLAARGYGQGGHPHQSGKPTGAVR